MRESLLWDRGRLDSGGLPERVQRRNSERLEVPHIVTNVRPCVAAVAAIVASSIKAFERRSCHFLTASGV
jgi:hypothetical protein